MSASGRQVITGLDRIAVRDGAADALVRGRRIGLLAHSASVDGRLRHARRVLEEAGARTIAFFAPEHGFGGEEQDMREVESERDTESGAPVYSLYDAKGENLAPRPEWLSGLDAVVVDLQDVGARYYTFVWTASLMLRTAAAAGVQTIVLDRPNPLGGSVVEGAPQRPGYRSFVGLYEVAVRHGLTIGELCEWVRRRESIDSSALEVVQMQGWRRGMLWEDTGLPWVFPSPNMPTPDTARVYAGACLLEGTSLSEGRGLTRPFEVWGGPLVDGEALADHVHVEGATLRPLRFRPSSNKHAGTICGGVQVHVTDPHRFRPYDAYRTLLAEVHRMNPAAFSWRTEPYEFVSDRPAIDLLTGGPEFRTALDAHQDLDEVFAIDERGEARFREMRSEVFLYGV